MAHIEKRGTNRWRARYRTPSGEERSRTFHRRVDAERFLESITTDLVRGEWADPMLGRILFSDWVKQWELAIADDLRPTTRELNLGVARNYLLPRFGAWPIARIRTIDVQRMVAEERKAGSLSSSAIRRHVIVLSTILASAIPERLARNPCAGVKLPPERSRKMRFLEPDEIAVIANAIHPHYSPLVLTAAFAGLRWGELAGLRSERVNVLRRTIRVEEQLVEVGGKPQFGPPKTRAGVRTVTIPATLADLLGERLGTGPVRSSGLVFPTPSGTPMRRSNFSTVWRRAVDGTPARPGVFAGTRLAGLVFHELRHTAAALAIAQGAHPVAIRERMGHSSIVVTMDTYGGLFPRLDEAIAEGLDGPLRDALAAWSRPDGPPKSSSLQVRGG